MAYDLPVYLFTGFLEGGKTHMIQSRWKVRSSIREKKR